MTHGELIRERRRIEAEVNRLVGTLIADAPHVPVQWVSPRTTTARVRKITRGSLAFTLGQSIPYPNMVEAVRICIYPALWRRLDPDERDFVIRHETAHAVAMFVYGKFNDDHGPKFVALNRALGGNGAPTMLARFTVRDREARLNRSQAA